MHPQTPEMAELERQLSKPTGETGIEVGEMMYHTNRNMILTVINALHIEDGDHVFELGHGNGKHLTSLFGVNRKINYSGLELSDTMHKAAVEENQGLISSGAATFFLYEDLPFPFPEGSFTRALTVNTIYFWKKPERMLAEFHRILKKGGQLAIGFGMKEMMQKMPFTGDRFKLYDDALIQVLVDSSEFSLKGITHHNETVQSKSGDLVEREFGVALLQRGDV